MTHVIPRAFPRFTPAKMRRKAEGKPRGSRGEAEGKPRGNRGETLMGADEAWNEVLEQLDAGESYSEMALFIAGWDAAMKEARKRLEGSGEVDEDDDLLDEDDSYY